MDTDEMPRRFGREAVWVVAMTMLGAGMRLKGLATLGLDHFDEGIYAQAAAWTLAGGGPLAIDPGLIPYAPPGFPVLVGLAYRLIGPSGTAAILVSILAGVLTIPCLAWLARISFGRGAGAATASFVALAGPHLVFSRTGLTDATFLLCWSLAMLAGARFLERPSPGRAARLGLAVGLAQLVKYNGAMAGAIVALAVLAGAIRPGDGRRSALRTLLLGLLAALVAAAVYLPWFLYVERTSGYAGLLAHHRSYVEGPSAWWANWRQQMGQAEAMVGLLPIGLTWLGVSVAMAWLGAAIGQGKSPRAWGRLPILGPVVVTAVVLISLLAPPNVTWWAALAWAPLLLLDARPAARLVATWFLVMAVSTPLYHPYARLWLPTLAASWVAGGGLIATLLQFLRGLVGGSLAGRGRPGWIREPAALVALGAIATAAIVPRLLPGPVLRFPDLLARSDGVRSAAEALSPGPGGGRGTIHLYARPPLRFYLAGRGASPLPVHGDLGSLRDVRPGPGDRAVVDAALGVTIGEAAAIGEGGAWRPAERLTVPVSIATLLDVRPDSLYDPKSRRLGLEIATEAVGTRDEAWAGSNTFWIYAAP